MVFNRYIDGFDFCEPPLCDNDITVEIIGRHCANWNLEVTWVIHDLYNRVFTEFDHLTVLWSINNEDLNFENDAYKDISPYRTNIDLQGYSGTVYLQASVGINGSTFKSSIETFDINDCIDNSNDMVKAKLCECVPSQVDPGCDLYVKEDAFSGVPRYFKYDDLCWYLDSQAWDDRIPIDPSLGVILESIDNQYASCEACCLGLLCPSEWVNGQAYFYIEYTTYTVRDHIIIIRNFDPINDDCIDISQNRIVWESDCVGTLRTVNKGNADCTTKPCEGTPLGEGPGEYIDENNRRSTPGSAPDWDNSFNGTKALCFLVNISDLPLGISMQPNCDPEVTSGTRWCAYIEGPGGYNLTICDADDSHCGPVPTYSSSSNSSISSSSISSSSISSSSISSSSMSSSSSSSISSSSMSSSSMSSSSSCICGTCCVWADAPTYMYLTLTDNEVFQWCRQCTKMGAEWGCMWEGFGNVFIEWCDTDDGDCTTVIRDATTFVTLDTGLKDCPLEGEGSSGNLHYAFTTDPCS